MEKIKLCIRDEDLAIMEKDMEQFGFLKTDGSINRNEFYNLLVYNYIDIYNEKQNVLYDEILSVLTEYKVNKFEANNIARCLVDKINQINVLKDTKGKTYINIKPTKLTENIFTNIKYEADNGKLHDSSISSYIRNVFKAYCSLPQNTREILIFKQTADTINTAIKKGNKIKIFKTDGSFEVISPFKISSSKEELFNYILCKTDKIGTRRLSRIKQVFVTPEKCDFTPDDLVALKRMDEEGPQYVYKNERFKVRLSEKGEELWKKIFFQRPKLIQKNNNIYEFVCSKFQIEQYFSRYGKEAVVVEPIETSRSMYYFYNSAAKEYRRIVGEKNIYKKKD